MENSYWYCREDTNPPFYPWRVNDLHEEGGTIMCMTKEQAVAEQQNQLYHYGSMPLIYKVLPPSEPSRWWKFWRWP